MRRAVLVTLWSSMLFCGTVLGVAAALEYTAVSAVVPGLSAVTDINSLGQVVGFANTSPGSAQTRSFLWSPRAGEMVYLGGTTYRAALGINDTGDVVGRSAYGPMVWPKSIGTGAGLSSYSFFEGVTPLGGNAWAVNNKSQIAGTVSAVSKYWDATERAVLWNPTGAGQWSSPKLLDAPTDASATVAHDINEAGQTAGWLEDGSHRDRAVRWESSGLMESLDELPRSTGTQANALNKNKEVVGNAVFGDVQLPVHWLADGTVRELPRPSGSGSGSAEDINDAGQIVGNTVSGATLWNPDGSLQILPALPGQTGSTAFAINNAGQIAGLASDVSGHTRAVVWLPGSAVFFNDPDPGSGPAPIPEPSSLALLGVCCLGSVLWLRRR